MLHHVCACAVLVSIPRKAQPSINTDELARLFTQKFGENVFCTEQMVRNLERMSSVLNKW